LKRSRIRPDTAANFAEREQARRLQHEWFLNSVIEARNPHLESTERYQRGALPASDPRWYSRLDRLRYLTRREMGRFDPNVDYPTLPPKPAAQRAAPDACARVPGRRS
jgi:hypothetical protein